MDSTTVFAGFEQAAAAHPRRVAVFYGSEKIRYRALHDRAEDWACRLEGGCQVRPGDRVGILLKNCPEFIVALYAALKCGAVVVPINTFLKAPEIRHIIEDCQVKCLVTSPDFNEPVSKLSGIHIVQVADLPSMKAVAQRELPIVHPSDLAVIIYTSGTTGKPKGAMLTHDNIASNVSSCIRALEGSPSDRLTLLLPMFHSFMLTVAIFTPLSMGAGIVLIKSVQPFKAAMKEIIRHRATILLGIPQLFQALAVAKIPFWLHWLLNLRLAVSGSAPLSQETLAQFEKKFRFPLLEGYGLSEAAPVVSFNPIHGARKAGSVGLPLPEIDVKILDLHDRETPTGEVGEIAVRGPNVMLGYYNQPQATAETLRNGWLHTGDMGRKDADGYIYIVDRRKEMLLVRGMNVYPREIEEVLYQCPGIHDAAVVARVDEKRGEAPVAFVTAIDGHQLDAKSVLQFCRERLADYKVPKEIRIVSELPRTPTGKVAKLELKKLAQQ
jgi:long-chain acyl-CoA synthetase